MLESMLIGRARLPPGRVLVPESRLSRSFALPIPGNPQLIRRSEDRQEPMDRTVYTASTTAAN